MRSARLAGLRPVYAVGVKVRVILANGDEIKLEGEKLHAIQAHGDTIAVVDSGGRGLAVFNRNEIRGIITDLAENQTQT